MPRNTIRPNRNTFRMKKNTFRGSGVVVLDRLHAKEAIHEDDDHKHYESESRGGSIVMKSNRVGGVRHSKAKRGGASQGADLYNRESTVRPAGVSLKDNHGPKGVMSVSGSGIIPNSIKIPSSLLKKEGKSQQY
jgi:hypothetical protein